MPAQRDVVGAQLDQATCLTLGHPVQAKTGKGSCEAVRKTGEQMVASAEVCPLVRVRGRELRTGEPVQGSLGNDHMTTAGRDAVDRGSVVVDHEEVAVGFDGDQ